MKRRLQTSQPRPLALVEYIAYPEEKKVPFKKNARQIFLGEIPNMPGHCVVSDVKTGRVYSGFHTDRFREIPEDET